jgi:hypothetical protein
MIDQFSLTEFIAWLDTLQLRSYEIVVYKGQYVARIPVYHPKLPYATNKEILIGSSIDPDTDMARPDSRDSIKCWLRYRTKDKAFGGDVWRPLGKDGIAHTKRTKNWRENLTHRLRDLWKMGLEDELERNPNFREAVKQTKTFGR